MTPHIMLDIETLGIRPGCAILSIGAVAFDPMGELPAWVSINYAGAFYRVISLQSCEQAGLHLDAETVAWWMNQSSKAREVFSEDRAKTSLPDALQELTQWLSQYRGNPIWTKGAGFDFPVIAAAYRATGGDIPWNYREEHCYRTLKNCWSSITEPARMGIAHHALDDALHQARHLQMIWRQMKCA